MSSSHKDKDLGSVDSTRSEERSSDEGEMDDFIVRDHIDSNLQTSHEQSQQIRLDEGPHKEWASQPQQQPITFFNTSQSNDDIQLRETF